MSTSITFNGVSYVIPAIADASWGTIVANYLTAISTGCLQKTGGAFTLSSADIDFGITYGLKSVYFKSKTANIAAAGVLMLAKTDVIGWRNNANGADLDLGINSSDQLTFNSVIMSDVASSQTLTNKLFSDSTCAFANVSDATKLLAFSLGGATTGTKMTIASSHSAARTLTLPDASDTFALLAAQQTLTNKLLSDSTAKFANVSDATKLLLFSLGGATTGKVMTIASSHANNRTLTLPDATDTFEVLALAQSPTNKTYDSSSTMTGVKIVSFTPDGTNTLTAPTVTDTLVAKTTTDTLTNKTLTAPQITGGSFINLLAQAATRFNDSSTNYVGIAAPSSVTTYSLALPAAQGAASTTLSNDGSGNLTWVATASAALLAQYSDIGNASNVRTATNTNLLGDISASTINATVTMTIAAPGVVTWSGHPFVTGNKTYLTTTGALPTGLTASTTYYVVVVNSSTYSLATTYANAIAGTKITTSGSQSGTHTAFAGGFVLNLSAVASFPAGLTSTGNVGIGAAADATGAVYITQSGGSSQIKLQRTSSSTGIAWIGSANGDIRLGTTAGGVDIAEFSSVGLASLPGGISGLVDGSSAGAGIVGEIISSTNVAITAAGSGSLKQLTSITLGAGDWDIAATVTLYSGGGVFTANSGSQVAISTTSASASGSVQSLSTLFFQAQPTTNNGQIAATISIPLFPTSVSSSTIYYLNVSASYTVTAPTFVGGIIARRRR